MTDRQAWRNTHPQYQIEKLKIQYQTMQQLQDQKVLGCGESPLESRGDDLSVKAADPVNEELCLNAEYQPNDDEGAIFKRSPRGSLIGAQEFWSSILCQQQHMEGPRTG